MEGASQEQLMQVKRQASLSGSSSADGEAVEPVCGGTHAELYCPYCYEEPYALNGLVEHIMDGHGYAQRSVKCPICRRPARDMMQHLLQHSQTSPRASTSLSNLPSSSRSAKEWLATSRLSDRSPSDWESYSEGSTPRHTMNPAPTGSKQPCSQTDPRASDQDSSGLNQSRLGAPAGTETQETIPAELPPEKPRPTVNDSPEMRVRFLEQLLLSAFQLDWR